MFFRDWNDMSVKVMPLCSHIDTSFVAVVLYVSGIFFLFTRYSVLEWRKDLVIIYLFRTWRTLQFFLLHYCDWLSVWLWIGWFKVAKKVEGHQGNCLKALKEGGAREADALEFFVETPDPSVTRTKKNKKPQNKTQQGKRFVVVSRSDQGSI